MASSSNSYQEPDLVKVIEDNDDFVQILGVNPSDVEDEVEVTSVEIDGDNSIFINIDEDSLADSPQEDLDQSLVLNENPSSDDGSLLTGDNTSDI